MKFENPRFADHSQLPQTWDEVLDDVDRYTHGHKHVDVRVLINLDRLRKQVSAGDGTVCNLEVRNGIDQICGFFEHIRGYTSPMVPVTELSDKPILLGAYKDNQLMADVDTAVADYVLLEVPMYRKNWIYEAFATSIVRMVNKLPRTIRDNVLVGQINANLFDCFSEYDIHITGLRFEKLYKGTPAEMSYRLSCGARQTIPLEREYHIAFKPEWERFVKIAALTKVGGLVRHAPDEPDWYISMLYQGFSDHFDFSNARGWTIIDPPPEAARLVSDAKAEVKGAIEHLQWQLDRFKQVIEHPLGSMIKEPIDW